MKLNPFRGLPNPKEVWAWGMYDLSNQSFTLLIITLLFPIYFREVIATDEASGERLWSILGSASLLVVVVSSPILGAAADGYGIKKRILIGSGIACGLLTCTLAMSESLPVWGPAAIFFVANVLYQLGENFLASFLPEISTPRNMGRVSATGWTMGYTGALLLLLITAGVMLVANLGVDQWEPLFLLAGIWFLVGLTAPALILKEAPARDPAAREKGPVRVAFQRIASTIRDASKYRQLNRFLVAFFVYALGIQTIVYFAGIIAKDFGFDNVRLILFVLQITVTAGLASAFTGFVQDRLGGRNTVILFLILWIISAVALFGLTVLPIDRRPEWLFWMIGNGIGLALGGAGASSRALVGRFTPKSKTAEFFGLWGMVYKLAGVIGVLGFGLVRSEVGDAASNGLLAGFFIVGLALMLRVNETAGIRSAHRHERDVARERDTLTQ